MNPMVEPEWLTSAMVVIDADERVVDADANFADFAGHSTESITGQPVVDLLAPFFVDDPTIGRFIEFLREKRTFSRWKGRIHTTWSEPESEVWLEVSRSRVYPNNVLHFRQVLPPLEELKQKSMVDQDLTEPFQYHVLTRAMEMEATLQNIHQRWPGIIFTQRPTMTFRSISPKVQQLTGLSPQELDRKPGAFWQIVHESDHAELKNNLAQARANPHGVNSTFRVRNIKTGKISYVMEHRVAVNRGGLLTSFHGVWIDVTRQIIAEKRLMGSAWKETLAVITMGLAHDFRNTMAGIASLSDTLIADLDPADPNKEYLDDIRKNSLHANQLVQRILDLHQGKTGEAHYADLNELTLDVGDLVRKITPRRIEFRIRLSEGTLPVWIDPVEFRQVVVNLVLNAVDAIERNGILTLRTGLMGNEPLPEHLFGYQPRQPSAFIVIEDTGCGISENHLTKIFEPFYTSKPMNKGSGLGLYNTRLFAERHQGAIGVQSTPGKGTAFTLFIPLQNMEEDCDDLLTGHAEDFLLDIPGVQDKGGKTQIHSSQSSAPTQSQSSQTGILVAGCHGRHLELTSSFLRSQGFGVCEVFQKSQALEQLENQPVRYGLLLVLIEDSCDEWLSYLDELVMVAGSIPLVLKLQNCDLDSLSDTEIQLASWIISPETPGPEVLEKLTALLREKDE